MYESHLSSFPARVNSINGKAYKNDPTIMMWDVINEPRCPGKHAAAFAGALLHRRV